MGCHRRVPDHLRSEHVIASVTSSGPFRSSDSVDDLVTLLPPLWISGSWTGTSDHLGISAQLASRTLALTSWAVPFESPAPTDPEEVARLRDRIIEIARLSRQEISRGIGVDRRSLSGFVSGEIRPTEARIRALRVLADSAEWAREHFGARAKDVLREDTGEGSPLDMIASGQTDVRDQMASAAEKLGLVRRGAVRTARRSPDREPLYLQARTVWADRIDKPTGGGVAREAGTYEQDLSEAIKDVPVRTRPRRRNI